MIAPKFNELLEDKYVLLYPTGAAVGIDGYSGGYPYKAYGTGAVKLWESAKDAQEYAKMFPNENFTLHRVVKVRLSVPISD
jgi:hypothetical protein